MTVETGVVSLLHLNGANGSTTFIDESGKTWTAAGNAQIDTSQFKFGGACLSLDGTGDDIHTSDSDDFYFGTGDFDIDFWIRFNSLTNDMRFAGQYADSDNRWYLRKLTNANGNKLEIHFQHLNVVKAEYTMTSAWSGVATNTWYHLEFVRNGTSILIFIDGVSQALTAATAIGTNDVGNIASNVFIGQEGSGSLYVNGKIDEFRVSRFAQHTTNFTPAAHQYPLGKQTVKAAVMGL